MSIILGKLGGYNLGRTQCVCKAWHYLGFNEELWASDCLEAFQQEPREATVQLMRTHFRSVVLAKPIRLMPRRSMPCQTDTLALLLTYWAPCMSFQL